MARNKGTFPFAANFEVKAASPLDPRVLVEKKAELISKDTWPLDGDTLYIYKGLLVSVQEESAIYMLVDPDKILETDYSGWERKDGNSPGEVSYEDIYIIEGLTAQDIETFSEGTLEINGKGLSKAIDFNKRVYIKYSIDAGAGIIPCSAYREDVYYVSFRVGSSLYGFDIAADSQYIDKNSIFHIDVQEKLKSGENIKTINGESILGEGDIKTFTSAILDFTVEDVYRAHQEGTGLSNADTISIVTYIDNKEQIYIHYDEQKHGIIPCGTYRGDESDYYILFIADNNVFKLRIEGETSGTVIIDSIINLEDIKAEITVDDQLSEGSTNPVQNKVITTELKKKANADAIPKKVSELTNDSDFVKSSTLQENYQPKGEYLTETELTKKGYIKDVDAELSDTSENPVQNKVITAKHKEISDKTEELHNTKISKNDDAYYPNISVGVADNLSGNDTIEGNFFTRKTGNGNAEDGTARIESLEGYSYVWNQFWEHGEITGNRVNTSDQIIWTHIGYIDYYTPAINGNKIYVYAEDKYNTFDDIHLNSYSTLDGLTNGKIDTANCVEGNRIQVRARLEPGKGGEYSVKVLFVDLTKMFGKGNEPLNLNDINNLLPKGMDLYEYNDGQIINMNVKGLKSFSKDNTIVKEKHLTSIIRTAFPSGLKSVGSTKDIISFDKTKNKWRAIKYIEQREYQEGDEDAANVLTDKKVTLYKLNTPDEQVLEVEDILDYEVWKDGTEEAIADMPTTPLHIKIAYGYNIYNKIKELEEKIDKGSGGGGGGISTPSGDPMHYLYEAAGAKYNDTEIDKIETGVYGDEITWKAGYWYLNELGDITNKQMRDIYVNWQKVQVTGCYYGSTLRTNLPFTVRNTNPSGDPRDIIGALAQGAKFETFRYNLTGYVTYVSALYLNNIFLYCNSLRKILDIIDISCVEEINNTTFGSSTLTELRLSGANKNVDLRQTKSLSYASIKYLIANSAAKSEIILTLNADTLTRAQSEYLTDIEQDHTSYEDIDAWATSKNIQIATA